MIRNLYAKYLLADRLNKRADQAGVKVAIIKTSSFGDVDVHVHVQGLGGMDDAANERATVALLEEWPELVFVSDRGLMYLRGVAEDGLTFEYYTGPGMCPMVQTGTRIVKRPDPEYIAAAPLVEVEEPVFERRCPEPYETNMGVD